MKQPAPFKMMFTRDGRVTVVRLIGELDRGSAGQFAECIALAADATAELVVDLGRLESIDAFGLRTLNESVERIVQLDRACSIRSVTPQIRRAILDIERGGGSVSTAQHAL